MLPPRYKTFITLEVYSHNCDYKLMQEISRRAKLALNTEFVEADIESPLRDCHVSFARAGKTISVGAKNAPN